MTGPARFDSIRRAAANLPEKAYIDISGLTAFTPKVVVAGASSPSTVPMATKIANRICSTRASVDCRIADENAAARADTLEHSLILHVRKVGADGRSAAE